MTSNPFEPEQIVLIDAPGPEEEDHFELPDHRHHCRLRLRGPGRPDPAARSAPSYGALSISDLLTAVLLFGQFARSLKSLLVLGCALSVRRLHHRPARIELSRRPRSQQRLRSARLYRKRTIPEASAIHEQVQTNRDLLTSWNTVTPGRVNNTKLNQ